MRHQDITVEVRDRDLNRVGVILAESISKLTVSGPYNNVGEWSLAVPVEHPMASHLRVPGAGIIIVGPDGVTLFSGPTVKPGTAATSTDPIGTLTVEGVSDDIVLADRLAFPQPDNPDPTTQTLAHDTRSGPIETLMHQFVSANAGPAAPAERRVTGLVLGTDLGRGPAVTKSARFPVLGNLVSELAVVAGLGFQVIQRGSQLVFETFAVTDKTREIRLDIRNNTLSGHRVATSAPGLTRAIVAGQGELVDRTFLALTTADSLAAEAEWGRRIERFIDQRNTNDTAELTQAGMEALSEEGFTAVVTQAVPMEDAPTMRFGRDWFVGDLVTVVVEDQELAARVTGFIMQLDQAGLKLGVSLGDVTGFDPDAATAKRVKSVDTRVSQLERQAEGGVTRAVVWLDPAVYSSTSLPADYPTDLSFLIPGSGWPELAGLTGVIETMRLESGYAIQTFRSTHVPAGMPEAWIRGGTADGWSAWQRLAREASVTDLAASVTSVANRVSDLEVMSYMKGW